MYINTNSHICSIACRVENNNDNADEYNFVTVCNGLTKKKTKKSEYSNSDLRGGGGVARRGWYGTVEQKKMSLLLCYVFYPIRKKSVLLDCNLFLLYDYKLTETCGLQLVRSLLAFIFVIMFDYLI